MSDGTGTDPLEESIERLTDGIKLPEHAGEPYRDSFDGQKLWPLYCSRCGAIGLWSTVPVGRGKQVPSVYNLLLSDGVTPMWTDVRGMLTLKAKPPAPDCPGCGESLNRSLRSRPLSN